MQHILSFFLVFLGGGAGSLCRYGIALLCPVGAGRFPWATLLANLLACLVLGIVVGYYAGGAIGDQRRLLLATGFCGGLSTFSTFIVENWGLWQAGQAGLVATNVALSLALCAGCLILGLQIAANH